MSTFFNEPEDLEMTSATAWLSPPPISDFVRDNAGVTWCDWLNMLDVLEANLQGLDRRDRNWKRTQAKIKNARTLHGAFKAEIEKNEKYIKKILLAQASMANAQDTGFQVQQDLVKVWLGKRSANDLGDGCDAGRISLSDRTNTLGSSVAAVQSPSITDIKGWSAEQLICHLQAKFPQKLSKAALDILSDNEIEGITFLELTKEELMADGMKRGSAGVIASYIEKLKDENHSKRARTTDLRGSASVEDSRSLEGSGEGADGLATIPDERLACFDAWMLENPVGLLRSPPFSGKTTLIELLSIYLRRLGRTVVTITIQESEKHLSSEEAFDAFWIAEAGISWNSCVNAEVQTDILVDEAQILYKHVPWFWSRLKLLMQGKNSLIRVLLVSIYGELSAKCVTTPITFPQSLGLDDLRLPRREFDTLVENFISIRYKPGFTIPDSTRDAVFNITGGHAGLVRETLKLLHDRSGDGCRGDEMNRFLVSPSYRGLLYQSSRSFYWMLSWVPDADEAEVLRHALFSPDPTFTVDMDSPKSADIVNRLIHHGIITHAAGERMQFAAPIMRIMLGQRLFYAPASLCSKLPATRNFEDFLLRSIERMRPSVLRESLSQRDADAPLSERAWQVEWYRAATTCIKYATISPDVGPRFGALGYLDFYVNSEFMWGVELLREGSRMREHAERFERGEYSRIPLKAWAIIDFRRFPKKAITLRPHFWYAMYADDFNTITVRRDQCPDVVLTLQGDEYEHDA